MIPCPPPDPNPHTPRLTAPALACDCHVHVFEAARFPYAETRGYTPPDATLTTLRELHETLGISRAVLTHASVHGSDPRAVLESARLDLERYRAVVTVAANVTEAELAEMHRCGARGMRVNLVDKGGMPYRSLDELERVAAKVAALGWHVEFLVHVHDYADLWPLASRLPCDVVIGHLGYMPAALGPDHPAFLALLRALEAGKTWVKLTGPYRISAESDLPYTDVGRLAQALIATRSDRILWGSDWPHVMCKKPMPNDGDLIDLVLDWAPDAATRKTIFVDNPARLYGFPS